MHHMRPQVSPLHTGHLHQMPRSSFLGGKDIMKYMRVCSQGYGCAIVLIVRLHFLFMMPQTLTQHLLTELMDHPERKDLVLIMSDIAVIGKIVSEQTGRIGLTSIANSTHRTNIQGEDVKELDVLANELCKEYLSQTGHFAALASEEEDTVVDLTAHNPQAQYIIAFDPLDGVSNISANIAVGTIFSIYKKRTDVPSTSEAQFLRKGTEQLIAGYIMYSTSTTLVFSWGSGVHEFTLNRGTGEFFLSKEKIRIPETCGNYSVNATYTKHYTPKDATFIIYMRDELGASDRYVGSLVADVHRNLIQGGVYMYFANDKETTGIYKPKLRMVYEVQPMSFLIRAAGGMATDGNIDILEKVPTTLHERTAVVMGNKKEVEYYTSLL